MRIGSIGILLAAGAMGAAPAWAQDTENQGSTTFEGTREETKPRSDSWWADDTAAPASDPAPEQSATTEAPIETIPTEGEASVGPTTVIPFPRLPEMTLPEVGPGIGSRTPTPTPPADRSRNTPCPPLPRAALPDEVVPT